MNTIILDRISHWPDKIETKNKDNSWNKFIDFADSQSKNRTGWFLLSLMVQGILFLPIPAVLMFYFNAPIVVLAITMVLFFANVIAGMGGSSIRVLISLFALSTIIHFLMLLIFII
jgi:hypothetical protein